MIYVETGLHGFFIDALVTYLSQAGGRFLDLSYEIFPEFTESIKLLLNREQSFWSELKSHDLEAAFSLFGYSIIICLLVFLFEIIFFFITTLFVVSLFSSLEKIFIY